MTKEAKKHHYNPKGVLRYFSENGKKKTIWVFDKPSGRSYLSSLADAGSENYFNTFEFKGKTCNFEHIFHSVDDKGAFVIRRLHKGETVASLSAESLTDLATFLAVQILRVKIQRTSMVGLSRELTRRVMEFGFSEDQVSGPHAFSDNDSRIANVRHILGFDRLAREFLKKHLVLFRNVSGCDLWTSDNPVALDNVYKFGMIGFSAKGAVVFLPIGPRLCVAFHCPSIYLQIEESLAPDHPRPREGDPWRLNLFEGIQKGTPVDISEKTVIYLNELQIGRSSRFLYSTKDDFDLARQYLEARPAARETRTLCRLGFPEPKEDSLRLAAVGEILVFDGQRNYFELAVSEIQTEAVAFRFTTADAAKLTAIEEDGPYKSVEHYVDGHCQQLVGEATLERLPLLDAHGRIQARVNILM